MKSNTLVRTFFVSTMLAMAVSSAIAATVIHVPADQPTIQAGINAAANGDTVLVSPGTYKENISFLGKAITVKSLNGPSVTTTANNAGGFTVTFNSNEGTGSVLQGFTITGGCSRLVSTLLRPQRFSTIELLATITVTGRAFS